MWPDLSPVAASPALGLHPLADFVAVATTWAACAGLEVAGGGGARWPVDLMYAQAGLLGWFIGEAVAAL